MPIVMVNPYAGCNIHCKYCFERKFYKKKLGGGYPRKMNYRLEAIFQKMEEFKDLPMALQGGEVLCLPKKDVEAILAKMYELKGKSALHTNATLIDNEWIEIFKKYKTKVGVSWDGPGELSTYRPGTNKVGAIIERLTKEGLIESILIVVSKANAGTNERLNKLKKYLLHLHQLKISGRLIACTNAPDYELNIEKLKNVYLDLADFCLHHNLRWSPFTDIINGLKGKDRVCVFTPCDPFASPSVIQILGDGSIVGCLRTDQFEGILPRHPAQYKTRNEILENVDQKYGGCKDCKYWTACYGGCSFDVINNDWRNRTYLCPVWKALFEFYENILSCCDISNLEPEQQPLKINVSQENKSHQDVLHQDYSDHDDISYDIDLKDSNKKRGGLARQNIPQIKKIFTIDFIGIAALRAGTTWISKCLAEHPEVCFASRKEVDFFGKNYEKGLKCYSRFFKNCDKGKIKGEFTPAYYMYDEAAQRIKKHFPNVKLIACLRNPIERALSHYKFKIKIGQKVNPDLAKELGSHRYYVLYGLYYQYLSRFFEYFDPKDILILIYEDALDSPAEFIKNIYRFLKINEKFIPKTLYKKVNITSKKIKMDDDARKNLRELFKDDIKNLEKLIGRDLSFWK